MKLTLPDYFKGSCAGNVMQEMGKNILYTIKVVSIQIVSDIKEYERENVWLQLANMEFTIIAENHNIQ